MKCDYYFTQSRGVSLHTSSESRFKSISLHNNQQYSKVIDQQMQVNELQQQIHFLKGKYQYELKQLGQLQKCASDSYFFKSRQDPQAMLLKDQVMKLRLQLDELNREQVSIEQTNLNAIQQQEQIALSDFISDYLSATKQNKLELLKLKTQLISDVRVLRGEIKSNSIIIEAQDRTVLMYEQQQRQIQLKINKYNDCIQRVRTKLPLFGIGIIKSEQSIDFQGHYKKLPNGSLHRRKKVEVINNQYQQRINSNTKLIENYIILSQQKSYQTISKIQNYENELLRCQELKVETHKQIMQLKIQILQSYKLIDEQSSDLENNSGRSDS